MSLLIRKPGLLTTVQDLGRHGARSSGVNPGGVMDRIAARCVNTLLGNSENGPLIETHFPAVEIEFAAETSFAIAGADFDAELDGNPVANWSRSFASTGSTLRFRRKLSGERAYIGVAGGIAADEWLGSSSTNMTAGIGGHRGRRLAANDVIETCAADRVNNLAVGPSLRPRYGRFPTVRILPGSEFEMLTATSETDFLQEGFTITRDCNRMGYRLSGKPLNLLNATGIVSAGVNFGTLQLLPDGQLIVLMADHQTSGGYPRVGSVVSVDLPLLAQCGPGDGVSFEMISIEDAERLSLMLESELNILRVGCRLQTPLA